MQTGLRVEMDPSWIRSRIYGMSTKTLSFETDNERESIVPCPNPIFDEKPYRSLVVSSAAEPICDSSENNIAISCSLLIEIHHPEPIVYMQGSRGSTIDTSNAVIIIDTWRCVREDWNQHRRRQCDESWSGARTYRGKDLDNSTRDNGPDLGRDEQFDSRFSSVCRLSTSFAI